MVSDKLILSLFDYTGNWPFYFKEAGYSVLQIDTCIPFNDDRVPQNILDFHPTFKTCYGILAAPPCNHFTLAANRLYAVKDTDGRTAQAVSLVHKALQLIELLKPKFWILENPVGRIPNLIPELGHNYTIVHPYEYAGYAPFPEDEAYTKRTCLWGNFKLGPKNPIKPVYDIRKSTHKRCSKIANSVHKGARSNTPLGLAYATYIGNT